MGLAWTLDHHSSAQCCPLALGLLAPLLGLSRLGAYATGTMKELLLLQVYGYSVLSLVQSMLKMLRGVMQVACQVRAACSAAVLVVIPHSQAVLQGVGEGRRYERHSCWACEGAH